MSGERDAQPERFLAAVTRNPHIWQLLQRLQSLELPEGCLAGGCLFQSVWNEAHGFDPAQGIGDYDLFYFDADDLSEEGELAVGKRVREAADDLGLTIDVRNQARVHLWYEREFGTRSPRFHSTEQGIEHFLATCCAFGLKRDGKHLVVHAPFGYDDLFDLIIRPNPVRVRANGSALRAAYARKVERWCRVWPRLRALPWP